MCEDRVVEMAWAVFLAGAVGAFAALETIALRTKRLPTLSRTLQRWMGVQPRNRWGAVSPFVFAAAGAWLSWHVARCKCDP